MDSKKIKSFWERPEGTTGMVFLVAILFFGLYSLYTFLPILISLMANTLYLTLMGLVLAFMLYAIVDGKILKIVSYFYKSLMRGITGIFIELDPIGILKSYIEDLEKKRKSSEENLEKIYSARQKLMETKSSLDKDSKEIMFNLEKAKETNNEERFNTYTRRLMRIKETYEFTEKHLNEINYLGEYLKKINTHTDNMISDIKDEVSNAIKRREIINTSHSAIKGAMSLIKAESSEKEDFDLSMEFLANDYAEKLGEISYFIDASSTFVNQQDFNISINSAEADKLLEEFKNRFNKFDNKSLTSNTISLTNKELEKVRRV